MAIGHDKRDLLRHVPRDKTRLRNKNNNATLKPPNEICTGWWLCGLLLTSFVAVTFVPVSYNSTFSSHFAAK